MTRSYALVSLALCGALTAPVPATAAPKRITLAGTVRITATTSAVIDVRLPKEVDVGDGVDAPPGTTITGDGRVVGALLIPADNGIKGMELVRFGLCRPVGCRPTTPYQFFLANDGRDVPGHEMLAAGDYRLAIVTDGRPVTIVLKFPGLKGTVNVKPTRWILARHENPVYVGETGGLVPGTAYTGSVSTGVDGGRAILLHQFAVRTDMAVQQHGGFCLYRDIPAEPAPRCPGGSGNEYTLTKVQTEPKIWAMVGRIGVLWPGTYRAGSFYRSVGTSTDPVGTVTTVVVPER